VVTYPYIFRWPDCLFRLDGEFNAAFKSALSNSVLTESVNRNDMVEGGWQRGMAEGLFRLDLNEQFPRLSRPPIVEAVIHWQSRDHWTKR
jgi:hypothetical protein